MQKTDGDGVDAERIQLAAQFFGGGLVQRRQYLAPGIQSFRNLEGQIPRDQGPGPGEIQIEPFRPVGAPDGVDIFEALRREQRRDRALAFKDRVDGDGRTMLELVDLREPNTDGFDAIGDALGRVVDDGR